MLFNWINGAAGRMPFWDATMWLAAEGLLPAVWGLLAVLWLWPGAVRRHRRKTVVWVVLAALLALGLSHLPGWFYYRPRPYMVAEVNLLTRPLPSPSFPSEHTATVAATAPVLGGYSRFLGTVVFLLAAVSGYARVYVGVHFLTDVLGGLVVGWLTGYVVRQNRDVLGRFAGRVVRRVERLLPF